MITRVDIIFRYISKMGTTLFPTRSIADKASGDKGHFDLSMFIHDSNLGFPAEQTPWPAFFSANKCDVLGTNNIELINQGLASREKAIAFVPVACAYGLRNDHNVKGLASSTTGRNGSLTTSSVLIVKRGSGLRRVADLKGKTYGRINKYCTSSYFSPAIYLWESGFRMSDFFKSIVDVRVNPGDWQNQIDQVIEGVVDATMVDECTWAACSKNAELTEIIGRMDGLPCPVVVSKGSVGEELADSLKELLFSSPRNPSAMFSGFAAYDSATVNSFFDKIDKALDNA